MHVLFDIFVSCFRQMQLGKASNFLIWLYICCSEALASPCFTNSHYVGIPLETQNTFSVMGNNNKNYQTSIQIASATRHPIWISWISDNSPQGSVKEKWMEHLNIKQMLNSAWTNDLSHDSGIFYLQPGQYVELPFTGHSVRITGSAGCDMDLFVEDPKLLIPSCEIGAGGPSSPQTLLEWTWSPGFADVIDVSCVDGFSLPLRLEYQSDKNVKKTIKASFTKNDCSTWKRNSTLLYQGCASPCSVSGNEIDCCSGSFSTPQTCHQNGIPVSTDVQRYLGGISKMVQDENNKRAAYAFAYDDSSGSITNHDKFNAKVKVTFCDDGLVYRHGKKMPNLPALLPQHHFLRKSIESSN